MYTQKFIAEMSLHKHLRHYIFICQYFLLNCKIKLYIHSPFLRCVYRNSYFIYVSMAYLFLLLPLYYMKYTL